MLKSVQTKGITVVPKRKQNPNQFDLFYEPTYPVRAEEPTIDAEQFQRDVARAIGRAMDASSDDRFEIAKRMAKALGQDDFSKAMLDAYASESKDTHTISLVRLIALIKATDQLWLMDFVASRVGGTVLFGEEPMLAEAARLDQEIKSLQSKKKKLTEKPIQMKRRQRS